jgi:hypothetical protein
MFSTGCYLLVKGSKTYINIDLGIGAEWWPEYDIPIGAPIQSAGTSIANLYDATVHVYRRNFDNGFVLVNPADANNTTRTVNLGGTYYLVQTTGGGFVPASGIPTGTVSYQAVTSVVLPPNGAAVLLEAPGWGTDTPGVYAPSSGAWFLRNTTSAGLADTVFGYGPGNSTLIPLSGDWDGDGDDTPGLYDPASGAFFLKNTNAPGPADIVFTFGAGGLGYVPIKGDWDGDGKDTVGLYNPSTGIFFLKNTNAPGPADIVFSFGAGGLGYVPLAGDWNVDGTDTVGLYNPSTGTFFLKNTNTPGPADLSFTFGAGGLGFVPVAGDWNGDGTDTVGLYLPTSGTWFLRDENASGPADHVFGYGPQGGVKPLVGDWNGM